MTKLNIFLPVILPLRPPNSGSSRMSHKKATVIGKNATGIRTEFSVIRTGKTRHIPVWTGRHKKKRPKASSFFYPTSKITITPDSQKDKSATPSGTPLGTDGGGRLDDSLAGVGYGKVDDNHGAHGVVGDEQHPTASFADALEAARFNLDFGRLARFERRLVQAHSQTGVIDL